MTGLVLPVVVEGWQHECCGDPIEVGGRVGWRLGLDGESWSPAAIDLAVTAEEVDTEVLQAWRELGNRVGVAPVLLRDGGLVAYLPDRSRLAGGRARGVLREDRHVDVPLGVPETAGTILRVRLVSRLYRLNGAQGWVDGTEQLLDVDSVPHGCFYETAPDGAADARMTTEVLVDLQVDPA